MSALFVLALAAWIPAAGMASDCSLTSLGLTPLDDLGAGLYLGQFEGGLYPGGTNQVPAAHDAVGLARAASIEPLDTAGNPDPSGSRVLLSIGMSNTTQEFCSANSLEPCDAWTFMGQAAVDPSVDHARLALVNGALGGQAAAAWESPSSGNYTRIQTDQLAPKGLTEAQVQVVWAKVANPGPTVSLPSQSADAFALLQSLGNIARTLRTRYPNLKILFVSSRIYAGYATTTLNPEPYAYESGFATKWLIRAQIDQRAGAGIDPVAGDLDDASVAPWIAWGPSLWADGLSPRGDGLSWACGDLEADGTHPSMTGEQKVGSLLLDFMLSSPYSAPWFRADGGSAAEVPVLGPWAGVALVVLLLAAAGALGISRA